MAFDISRLSPTDMVFVAAQEGGNGPLCSCLRIILCISKTMFSSSQIRGLNHKELNFMHRCVHLVTTDQWMH